MASSNSHASASIPSSPAYSASISSFTSFDVSASPLASGATSIIDLPATSPCPPHQAAVPTASVPTPTDARSISTLPVADLSISLASAANTSASGTANVTNSAPLTTAASHLTSQSPRRYVNSNSRRLPWRSFSLRWPYLSFLIFLSLLLLGSVETLRQISNRQNGVYHLDDPNPANLSTGVTILYTYIPTLSGVIYSILWSYIDSDTKRLEPYIQMKSRRSPSDVLFLDYAFESAFVTPYRALRRKHWFVAAVSLIYLLISLILPASQGALLNIENVSYTADQEGFQLSHSSPVWGMIPDGEFVDQAKAIGITDNAKIPPWTTLNYSVASFWPATNTTVTNQSWTARSMVSYAQPKCRRFNIENTVLIDGVRTAYINYTSDTLIALELMILANVSIIDTPSCNLTMSIYVSMFQPLSPPTYIFPIFTFGSAGGKPDVTSGISNISIHRPLFGELSDIVISRAPNLPQPYAWRDPEQLCPDRRRLAGSLGLDFSQTIVTNNTWNVSTIGNKLVLYDCTSEYRWAMGSVTVKASSGEITNVGPFDYLAPFSQDEFNGTAWEDYLENNVLDISNQSSVNSSLPELNAVGYRVSVGDIALYNLMSGSGSQDLYHVMSDDDRVGDAFESGYKLIFALAMSALFKTSEQNSSIQGSVDVETYAIVVVSAFALLSEVLLAVAIVVLLVLIFGYQRRSSILCSDPDSISAQCAVISNDFSYVGMMASSSRNLDQLSTKDLAKAFESTHLEFDEGSASIRVVNTDQPPASTDVVTISMATRNLVEADPLPFFLSRRGVSIAVAILGAIIISLIFVVILADRENGFSFLADSSSFQSQLFWSFVPTLVATFAEAAWMTLHRDLCVLEPWVAIRKGHTSAQNSLSLRYSSRPPSLVFYMSAKKKHFLLALVSFSCVTTSVLSISMASLFQGTYNDIKYETNTLSYYTLTAPLERLSTDCRIDQAFSVLRNELSSNGALPVWTMQDFSLMPVNFTNSGKIVPTSQDVLSTSTLAIESSLNCTEFAAARTSDPSGPGIFIDKHGGVTIRYRPYSVTNVNTTCMAIWEKNTVQSIRFTLMYSFDLPTGSWHKDYSGDCSKLYFVTSYDVASQVTSYYTCESRISVSNVTFEYSQDIGDFSLSLEDEVGDMSSVFPKHDDILLFFGSEFIIESELARRTTATTDYDWPGLLMTRIRENTGTKSISELADQVWRRVFAIWFSTYRDRILTRRNDEDASLSSTTGTITRREARIVPVIPAFIVTVALFVLHLVVYILVVIRRRHRYVGPRMPKTIGSLIPWVIHSRMLDDFAGTHKMNSQDREDRLRSLGRRYGFGRFHGRHGKMVLGLEYEEFIIARGAYGDF